MGRVINLDIWLILADCKGFVCLFTVFSPVFVFVLRVFHAFVFSFLLIELILHCDI